jgi:formylglycine-generating enzyme required for sulfatase activity
MKLALLGATVVVGGLLFWSASTYAVTIDMVFVGNPGNAPDTERMNDGTTGYGSVGYAYQIGKYEVTAAQYTEFLNAVAATDTYDLWSPYMADPSVYGCRIQRDGAPGSYTYSVTDEWAQRPVNFVNVWDAARFVNWLHNGQPGFLGYDDKGIPEFHPVPQDRNSTEDGAYLNIGDLFAFARQPGARFVLPTEDEWYKAAYHDKNAGLAANYFDYPTGTNSMPGHDVHESTNPGNNANMSRNGVYAIGNPYYRSNVGDFELSESSYGTFDQGGNVWEWNETLYPFGGHRGYRGGPWANPVDELHANYREGNPPFDDGNTIGFRVATLDVANPTVYVDVDPTSTYLRTADEPHPGLTGQPLDAQAIPLATVLGVPIVPGDLLYLQRVGNFRFTQGSPPDITGPHGDWTLRNLWGVFSSSDELLMDDPQKSEPETPTSRFELENGVTSAIPPTEGTFQLIDTVDDPIRNGGFQHTNIPEDFEIGSDADPLENPPGVYVRVPEGATHLFVGAGDVQWFDNSLTRHENGNIRRFGLNITLVTELAQGDYNGNGVVDAADYDSWRTAFGSMVEPGSGADGNGDGMVDAADYVLWRNSLGQTALGAIANGNSSASTRAAVPEPAAWVMGLMSLLLAARRLPR